MHIKIGPAVKIFAVVMCVIVISVFVFLFPNKPVHGIYRGNGGKTKISITGGQIGSGLGQGSLREWLYINNVAPGGPICEIGYDKIIITEPAADFSWAVTTINATSIPVSSTRIEFSFVIPEISQDEIMLGMTGIPDAVVYNEHRVEGYVRRIYIYKEAGRLLYWYTSNSENDGYKTPYAAGDRITYSRIGNVVSVYQNNSLVVTDDCPGDYQYIQIITQPNFPVPFEISVTLTHF